MTESRRARRLNSRSSRWLESYDWPGKAKGRGKGMKIHKTTILCPTAAGAHALRHELDRLGALSKRMGKRVDTSATAAQLMTARKKARRSTHHGHTR